MREVGFLRVVIELDGIKMEEEKVKGVLDWLTPKCIKDVQKFLGLANYYCRFIEGFASIARPLHDMVKKVGLDQKVGKGIWRVEGVVYKRTSVSST